MKKIITSIALFAVMLSVQSQVPTNLGFEQWTSDDDPENWFTIDQLMSQMIPIPGLFSTVTQSTDSHSGNFAAKVEVQYVDMLGQTYSGLLGLGAPDKGQPYTLTPASFSVWVKYHAELGDSIIIYAELTKWNGTERIEVASTGEILTGTQSTFQQLTFPFDYHTADTPDSLNIIFMAGAHEDSDNFPPIVGTYIIVDDIDIAVDGGVVGISENKTEPFRISPNPAKEVVTISNVPQGATIEISDLTGKTVFSSMVSEVLADTTHVDVSTTVNGVYFVKVSHNGTISTEKLVIQK